MSQPQRAQTTASSTTCQHSPTGKEEDDQPLRSVPASRMFAVQSTRWPKGQMIVSVSS